jgi:Ca2+-binding EF-hand superfamily protein
MQALSSLGVDGVEALIDEADTNGDGCIDYSEYCELIARERQ